MRDFRWVLSVIIFWFVTDDREFPKTRLAGSGESSLGNTIGTDATVPESQQGKYVPVVYGVVQHSPCVVVNEDDPVYSNVNSPTKSPTIYCDNDGSGSKIWHDSNPDTRVFDNNGDGTVTYGEYLSNRRLEAYPLINDFNDIVYPF